MSTHLVVVRSMPPRRRGGRRGAALPVVILLMVILALSLTAGFTLNSNEMRVVDSQQEQIEAFALAESGRQRYVLDRASFGLVGEPAPVESVRVNLYGGYADVVATRLRPSAIQIPGLYAVRSTGVRTHARMADVPAARRTVGQIFKWETGYINAQAAWTSLSGVRKNGGAGVINGTDACGVLPAVGGVAVPTIPGYLQLGGASTPAGNPPIDDLGTQAAANDSVNVDWAGIVSGSSITPTITIPPQTFPPASAFTDPNYWPIIKVTGNFMLPIVNGRGVLIVTGNFTIGGGSSWNGVLLVGGTLTSNGNSTIRGAAISGLNTKLGMLVPISDIGNGEKTFQYDSCLIQRAMESMSGLVPFENAWADNWASY